MTDLLDAARRLLDEMLELCEEDERDMLVPPSHEAIDDLDAALSEYEWSEEPPSEPGWYWLIDEGEASTFAPRPVEIVKRWDAEEAKMVADKVSDTMDPCGVRRDFSEYEGCTFVRIPEPTDTES